MPALVLLASYMLQLRLCISILLNAGVLEAYTSVLYATAAAHHGHLVDEAVDCIQAFSSLLI